MSELKLNCQFIHDDYVAIGDKQDGDTVEILMRNTHDIEFQSVEINRDQAIQLINHLKTQFSL